MMYLLFGETAVCCAAFFSKIYLTFCHFALDFLLFTVYIHYRF